MASGGAPFDGYHRRAIPAPDPEVTEVGPGTPCGEYLRRFWQPVAFAREIAETPLRVRILGEDLVVFRDRGGRAGVLHLHCTFTQDTVLRISPAETPEADRRLLRATGLQAVAVAAAPEATG
ncbi:MAG TPA: Rieske 2Fe-2S domain-containing protein [Candidatus Limnocylindrales bacterium]|nr:Rieske 2Fe-2S domain-containing protein [Candidatus Limnocylindrales bacterium]